MLSHTALVDPNSAKRHSHTQELVLGVARRTTLSRVGGADVRQIRAAWEMPRFGIMRRRGARLLRPIRLRELAKAAIPLVGLEDIAAIDDAWIAGLA